MSLERIYRIRVSYANAWLMKSAHGLVLVDSGPPGTMAALLSGLARLTVSPESLGLAAATHVHVDHVGNFAALSRRYGTPTAVSEAAAPMAARGDWVLPGASTRFSRLVMGFAQKFPEFAKKFLQYPRFLPDLRLADGQALHEQGFPARVIATPGHTFGSVSFVSDEGNAFVGDLAYNDAGWLRKTVRPLFASDLDRVAASWKALLDAGAKTIHPGHGPSFPASRLARDVRGFFNKKS